MRKRLVLLGLLSTIVVGAVFYHFGRSLWYPAVQRVHGKRSVDQAVAQFGPAADQRLAAFFQAANVPYPPSRLTLIAIKEEKRLEVWAEHNGRRHLVKSYDVKAASGTAGPKLREGDRQVPEGFYQIEGFNPNSSYHLSLKLNYPNAFDVRQARAEGRTRLGGDIFIHGKAVSIGCLAIGDEAIEELFVLVGRVGRENVSVMIAPRDFRKQRSGREEERPAWVDTLYSDLERELRKYQM